MAFPLIPVAISLFVGGAAGAAGTAYYSDAVGKTEKALEAASKPAEHASNAIISLSACVAICALCYAGLKISGKG